jgi:hypothetical protein
VRPARSRNVVFFPTAAAAWRVQRAKTLLDETTMPMSAIAFAAGFASIRRMRRSVPGIVVRRPRCVARGNGRDGRIGASGAKRQEAFMAGQRRDVHNELAVMADAWSDYRASPRFVCDLARLDDVRTIADRSSGARDDMRPRE